MLGYYCAELLRSTRLVVDTGIHAFRWTREQVSIFHNFLTNFSICNLHATGKGSFNQK